MERIPVRVGDREPQKIEISRGIEEAPEIEDFSELSLEQRNKALATLALLHNLLAQREKLERKALGSGALA